MQSNSARPPCWHPPSGPNPPRFEMSDHDNTQRISQLEPYGDIFQYPGTLQEEEGVLQWPPRQAPLYQGVQDYTLHPFAGTASVEDPAVKLALKYNGFPFSENLSNLNDLYAYNATTPRNAMEYPDGTYRTANQVRRENIGFPALPLPRPAAFDAQLALEVSPNNVFRVDPLSFPTDTTLFVPVNQRNFSRNSPFSSVDSRDAAYANHMNGLAPQTYAEDVHRIPALVQPPSVLLPSNHGRSVSNENGTSPEFVQVRSSLLSRTRPHLPQWLNFPNKNNPAKDDCPYPPEGYGAASSLREIEQKLEASPETALTSLSPTPSSEASKPRRLTTQQYEGGPSRSMPSRGLQTQFGVRPVAPYPAASYAKEEPQLKNSKQITPISLSEAEDNFGPKIREYWGTSRKIPDPLLWETRSAVEGGGSVKKRSKCKICGSLCSGSAALYHARKHLNINPYPCEHKDCPDSFAQSSDRRNHMEKIHQKYSNRSSTPTTSSQDPLTNLYHG